MFFALVSNSNIFRTLSNAPFSFLLGLDAAGKIVRIFPDNLLTFPLNFDCLFSTISVSTDNNGNFNILGVTLPDDQGKTYLKMFTYPGKLNQRDQPKKPYFNHVCFRFVRDLFH